MTDREWLEYRFLINARLVALADEVLYYHNPCQIKGGACMVADPNPCCVRTRFKRFDGDKTCRFLFEYGCGFPNIGCKVYLCDTATQHASPECLKALQGIKDIADIYGLIDGV